MLHEIRDLDMQLSSAAVNVDQHLSVRTTQNSISVWTGDKDPDVTGAAISLKYQSAPCPGHLLKQASIKSANWWYTLHRIALPGALSI